MIRKLRNLDKVNRNASMPPWYYLPEHSDARLSPTDRDLLAKWTSEAIAVQQTLAAHP
jgi:hypothetical protein